MKQILLICLIVFCIAARHHTLDTRDVCLAKNCKAQAQACATTANCPDLLLSCGQALQVNRSFDQYYACLNQIPQARTLSDCMISKCLSAAATDDAAMFLNRLN